MRIELSTKEAAAALADYLQRCECTVEIVSDNALEVCLRGRPGDTDPDVELTAYLRVWSAMHPELEGEFFGAKNR